LEVTSSGNTVAIHFSQHSIPGNREKGKRYTDYARVYDEILEKLASLRMNITVRLDNDRKEGDPVSGAYILVFIDFAAVCYCGGTSVRVLG